MSAFPLAEAGMLEVLDRYLDLPQTHPSAEEIMGEVVTEDFETAFPKVGGWQS